MLVFVGSNSEIIGESKIDLSVSDTDRDGFISVMDATRIQKHLAGLIATL